jgi:hypothetical protein
MGTEEGGMSSYGQFGWDPGVFSIASPPKYFAVNALSYVFDGDAERKREADLPHRTTSEPVVGWRAWRLAKDETGGPVLLSSVMNTEWAGPVFRADTKPTLDDSHGVHAFRRTYMNTEYGQCTVEGEVLLFGKTIVFEKGIRAEAAMIRRLVLYPGGWAPGGDIRGAVMLTINQYMSWGGGPHMPVADPPAPRKVHSPHAAEKCGVEETTSLMGALAKRYDCEVSLGRVVKRSEFEPAKKRIRRRTRLIQKPTREEVDRYGSR